MSLYINLQSSVCVTKVFQCQNLVLTSYYSVNPIQVPVIPNVDALSRNLSHLFVIAPCSLDLMGVSYGYVLLYTYIPYRSRR